MAELGSHDARVEANKDKGEIWAEGVTELGDYGRQRRGGRN